MRNRTLSQIFVTGLAADEYLITRAAAELTSYGFAVAVPDLTLSDDADDLLARVSDDLAAVESAAAVAYLPGGEDTLEVAHAEMCGVPALRFADLLAIAR